MAASQNAIEARATIKIGNFNHHPTAIAVVRL
jgi:hypothetical protein